jgi:hypothetical protein
LEHSECGAFKADFFSVLRPLFIFTVVSTRIDIELRSNLDVSVPPDVGFMTPR